MSGFDFVRKGSFSQDHRRLRFLGNSWRYQFCPMWVGKKRGAVTLLCTYSKIYRQQRSSGVTRNQMVRCWWPLLSSLCIFDNCRASCFFFSCLHFFLSIPCQFAWPPPLPNVILNFLPKIFSWLTSKMNLKKAAINLVTLYISAAQTSTLSSFGRIGLQFYVPRTGWTLIERTPNGRTILDIIKIGFDLYWKWQ